VVVKEKEIGSLAFYNHVAGEAIFDLPQGLI